MACEVVSRGALRGFTDSVDSIRRRCSSGVSSSSSFMRGSEPMSLGVSSRDFRARRKWEALRVDSVAEGYQAERIPVERHAESVQRLGLTAGMCVDRPSAANATAGHVLEKWVERSVVEIVRHLPQAPFLQYHFDAANSTYWQRVSEDFFERPQCWNSLRSSSLGNSPDGLLLVRRLDPQALSEMSISDAADTQERCDCLDNSGSTDVWGVLVQGCGSRWNACYILKTTTVASATGTCTHYFLKRAKCFGPSIKCQLESTWLL